MPVTAKYTAFILQNPNRLVVDLANIYLTATSHHIAIPSNTIIKSIRYNNETRNHLRLVFDLRNFAAFVCHVQNKRVTIDLIRPNTKKPAINQPRAGSSSTAIIKPRRVVSPGVPACLRQINIVIDPGHGGEDPGAVGVTGVREKDVVLAVSKYLQSYLNQCRGFHAVLTRNSDYFIPLRGRLAIARKDKADMFIAVHADAYSNINATGATVFALSQHGATSELARVVARNENESELGHVIADKNHLLKSVLVDLTQTLTIDNSLAIGNSILRQISIVTDLHCRHMEQAGFVVLKSPDIPSLLVETGFLTNPAEESRLKTSEYQQKIAFALAQGIKNYFAKHPSEEVSDD